jgi:hypothetical protein
MIARNDDNDNGDGAGGAQGVGREESLSFPLLRRDHQSAAASIPLGQIEVEDFSPQQHLASAIPSRFCLRFASSSALQLRTKILGKRLLAIASAASLCEIWSSRRGGHAKTTGG